MITKITSQCFHFILVLLISMLSPYANSAVLASRAVKQTYKGLLAELYAIHNGQLSQVGNQFVVWKMIFFRKDSTLIWPLVLCSMYVLFISH